MMPLVISATTFLDFSLTKDMQTRPLLKSGHLHIKDAGGMC